MNNRTAEEYESKIQQLHQEINKIKVMAETKCGGAIQNYIKVVMDKTPERAREFEESLLRHAYNEFMKKEWRS